MISHYQYKIIFNL